jgi:hypothetical protein
MSDTKEYIKGDKHVHQAGSIMIKFAQYNVPEQKGDWKQQEEKEAEELEKEFADFEEVVEEKAEADGAAGVEQEPPQENLLSDVDRFIDRVKAIFAKAAEKNGETITVNAKGWSGQYTFYVDADRISRMLDDLRQNSKQKVKEYLDLFKGCTSVSAVAPLVGEILDIEELRVKELQKSDMKFALEPFYGKSATAVSKLSSKVGKTESEMLINTLKGLLRKYPKS